MGCGLNRRKTMAGYHRVEQGEHLGLIAKSYGFASYTSIWNHENNATLRETRQNPNVLLAGDQVFIPDRLSKTVEIDTGKFTRFQVRQEKILLRLMLDELFGEPLANVQCEIRVDGKTLKKTTDENAIVEVEVAATAQAAELVVKEPESRLGDVVIPIKIGHLDPVEEQTGQIARLNNLGYFAGSSERIDEQLLKSAVEEFQCDQGLTVDGKCGPVTQAKLKKNHGC